MTLKRTISTLTGALALLVCVAANANDASALLTRFKAATGGAHWDQVHSLRENGTLSTGGLTGPVAITTDVRTGRSVSSYQAGPISGASGFDGKLPWDRSPGGEVAAHNDPAAIRVARSQAWLDARSYWYPQRGGATYQAASTRKVDGKTYRVIAVTPVGSDPLTLWFAPDSSLLVRVVQPQDGFVQTTRFNDYRTVDGLRLPFHFTIDHTDAAGHTDPRSHLDVQFAQIHVNTPITDDDFAVPAMKATAHINNASGTTRIPFDLVNNHIYVDAMVDGKPARLLVDTGGVNLLTPAAAKKFGLTAKGKLAVHGVGKHASNLALARGKQLQVGAATLDDPVFYVVDLGNLAQIEDEPFDGLIGYEMFRRFDVQIDYAAHKLTLSEPRAFVPPPGATTIPFALNGSQPIIAGTLDGMPWG